MEKSQKKKLPKTYAGKSAKPSKDSRSALAKAATKANGNKNPAALIVSIGVKKYGKKKMAKTANTAKKKK